jgi:hypothetical protein
MNPQQAIAALNHQASLAMVYAIVVASVALVVAAGSFLYRAWSSEKLRVHAAKHPSLRIDE